LIIRKLYNCTIDKYDLSDKIVENEIGGAWNTNEKGGYSPTDRILFGVPEGENNRM
jgi:hypothetical protein